MNTDTGKLATTADVEAMGEEMKKKFIPVKRDLTKTEEAKMQIRLYSPCGCGSGKKFKWCCKTKQEKKPIVFTAHEQYENQTRP